ncbi:MAG: Uncharacterized MFS-type transporter, partial [uncultured Thermomicrobiales bacterium]
GDWAGASGAGAAPLRLGRLRRDVRHAPRRRRVPLDAGRPDGAAGAGVRLEPGDRRLGRLGQPAPVRLLRSVRRRADAPLRHPPRRLLSPGRHRRRRPPDDPGRPAVATRPALGRRRRPRRRLHGDGAGGDDRQPLVRRAARPRPRATDGGQRHRPTRLPADAGLADDRCRLAVGGGGDRDRCPAGHSARCQVPARLAARGRRATLRREDRRPAPGHAGDEPHRLRGRRTPPRRRPPRLLAPGRDLLRLWVQHQRPDRHPPHPGQHRPRHGGDDRRRIPRPDRHLRRDRHHGLRLADRPLGPAQAPLRLLRPARPLAAAAADGVRRPPGRLDPLRRLLWAGLGGDGTADRFARLRHLRPPARPDRLRLDLLGPPGRSRRRRHRRRPGPHRHRRLRARLPGRRGALPGRGDDGAGDRSAAGAGGRGHAARAGGAAGEI